MNRLMMSCVITAGVLTGCATTGGPEQVECYQPNRRVSVEIVGTKTKPAPKPKEGEKPAKPQIQPSDLNALVQGNSAFDFKSAVLKPEGKVELDNLVKQVSSGVGKDTRPLAVGSIIITGHSDVLEARESDKSLSEARAKTVMEYLTSKGLNPKLMFWEGQGSRQAVPVTKFCQ